MLNSHFNPSFFHPYYFIRKGLLKKISEHGHLLTGKLLDFGCGSKPYKSLFKVEEYIGVDFENEGHPHDTEQIDVFYDGKKIPFNDEVFDSALSSEVFEHIFNLEDVLKELNRVLKPGGLLLITCPFVWKEHEMPNDFARYTHFGLEYLFSKNGFEVIVKDKTGCFMQVLFQLQILFFYDNWYRKVSRIPIINFLFKLFFIALPNLIGVALSKLFFRNKSMYLNNVMVVRKCK